MEYSKIKNMKNSIYYTIYLFRNKNENGQKLKNEYIRVKNALKTFEQLKNSGVYACIILRKNEVILRNKENEFSCSSVYKIHEL